MRVTAGNGSQRRWESCNTGSALRRARALDPRALATDRSGDKKGQLALPFFAASLPAKASDEAGITSLLPCR
jgi:hypothetical protein